MKGSSFSSSSELDVSGSELSVGGIMFARLLSFGGSTTTSVIFVDALLLLLMVLAIRELAGIRIKEGRKMCNPFSEMAQSVSENGTSP